MISAQSSRMPSSQMPPTLSQSMLWGVKNYEIGLLAYLPAKYLIYFHNSRFRDFKNYYNCIIKTYRKSDLPSEPSYTRFISLIPRVLLPLTMFLVTLFDDCTGISFVDSTRLEVCGIMRERSHQVFKDVAR